MRPVRPMELLDLAIAFLGRHGYTVVLVVAAIDALGVPFPGRLLMVAAGAIAPSAGLNVALLILLAATGAVAGDHVWYLAGRLDPRQRLLHLFCRLIRGRRRCVERAERYVQRWGPMTFVIGRLFAAIRILTAPIAAAAGVGYGRFLVYDAAGALLWAGVFVLIGRALGGW